MTYTFSESYFGLAAASEKMQLSNLLNFNHLTFSKFIL
jgi:hypothetical protein